MPLNSRRVFEVAARQAFPIVWARLMPKKRQVKNSTTIPLPQNLTLSNQLTAIHFVIRCKTSRAREFQNPRSECQLIGQLLASSPSLKLKLEPVVCGSASRL